MKCGMVFWVLVFTAWLGRGVCEAAAGAVAPQKVPVISQPVVAPPAAIPVYEGRDLDQIADDDTVITQVIPLEYLSAADMRNTLLPLIKQDTPLVAAGNALVVTEASNVVRRIVKIVNYIDVQRPNGNVIAVVPLTSGDAAEMARLINAVLGGKGPGN